MMDIVLVNNPDEGQLSIYSVKAKTYDEIFAIVPEFVKKRISEIKDGYGLSFYSQSWPTLNEKISLVRNIYEVFFPDQKFRAELVDDDENSDCSAGEPGSTCCSVSGCVNAPTSCNVSCATGYHSCFRCEPLSQSALCFCVANKFFI